MIYFKEQYYDSFIEMVDEEMWDAYDANENKLGFEVRRSMAKSLPEGVYHIVVMVYTVTKTGKVLTTQRSRNKTNSLKWEVTGGSIISGETPRTGAVRELLEETGIKKSPEDLIELYRYNDKCNLPLILYIILHLLQVFYNKGDIILNIHTPSLNGLITSLE